MKPRNGIVQVIFHPVGGRRFVEPLVKALIADGQQCELWIEPVKGTEDFLKGFTVPVKICPSKLGFNPLKAASAFLALLKNLRERNPLILHAHLFRGAFLPLLAAKFTGVPVRIYHNHGVSYVGYRGILRFVLMIIEGANCRLATHVMTVNETLCPALRAVAPRGTVILVFGPGSICGLDASEYAPTLDDASRAEARSSLSLKDSDLILLYIGRPNVHKGFPFMLEAFARRFAMRDDVMLLICGCGPDDVKRVRPDAPKNIRALGYLQNLHPVYRASDAILLPSLYEGLPYSLLEGAAQGCAMIASNIPGPDALIEEGKNGLYVKAGDVDDLVRALDQAAGDRAHLKIMGNAAFEKAQSFEREKVLGPYVEFIQQVMGQIDSRFHPGSRGDRLAA